MAIPDFQTLMLPCQFPEYRKYAARNRSNGKQTGKEEELEEEVKQTPEEILEFITTSQFSHDAQSYVNTISQKIVLIDGEQLAQLMIDHGVGVTDVAT